ncbi:hypothetical protein MRB53_015901, partial [Persea americana]
MAERRKSSLFLLVVLSLALLQLLLFLNVRAVAPTTVAQEAAEAQALLTWKASLENHSLLSSWSFHNNSNATSRESKRGSTCNWLGITCNVARRITRINLFNASLRVSGDPISAYTAQVVAVKKLDRNGLQGHREFLVVVLMLCLLHHQNLVNLIGYCADGDQRLLEYEFMSLGSLENLLEAIPLSSNIHHFLPIKLSPTNYLMWRSQFMPLLKGHNLMGFIDGTNPCPPIFVSAAKDDGSKSKEDDSPSLNPDYVSWSRQDQLLLSWILSSLTEGVHAQVVGLSTSYEVWHHLATTYASTSKARIMQLRLQLHQLKKGADTMSEFLLKAKSIADQLAMALKPIDDDDLVLYILGGLGSEYGPFVTSITTRETHIRLSDLHGLLLSEEIRVNGSQNDLQNITANVAAKSSSSSNRGK